jgi:signal peptidase I
MLSSASIATILIIVCDCIIYFFLAFRIKRQRWFISLALLAVVWLMLPMALRFSLNVATMRVRNDGYSMMPALTNGDYILADRLAYQKHLPKRGDIIILTSPTVTGRDLIKRIIGLPGETVKIAQGQVLINGVLLNEPYISVQAAYRGEWKIPQDQYFVLGDNRNDSQDSHQWGLLPKEYILAKAVWIYWPSAQFGRIEDINCSP